MRVSPGGPDLRVSVGLPGADSRFSTASHAARPIHAVSKVGREAARGIPGLRRQEKHAQWLRDLRVAAYADFYGGGVHMVNEALRAKTSTKDSEKIALGAGVIQSLVDHQLLAGRVALLAEVNVQRAAEAMRVATIDGANAYIKGLSDEETAEVLATMNNTRGRFLGAAKQELGLRVQ